MHKAVSLVIALFLVFTYAAPAGAQGPRPQHTSPAWDATYWNNTSLSGAPVLQREESSLDYNWGAGSPAGSVRADDFSARWSRYIDVTPGTYRFTATGDDGMRVWVDQDLIINDWSDHPARTSNADIYLDATHHLVTVDYYENGGDAVARVSWTSASQTITQWRGEYFNNRSLSGSPVIVIDEHDLNFDWGGSSPAPGTVNADQFSARWTRSVNFSAGTYRFSVTADDGVRLWVNGHLLVDAWRDQGPTTFTGDLYLPGGSVPIKMEYYENGGGATARLSWAPASQTITQWRGEYYNNRSLSGSPVIVINDTDIDFDWGGSSPVPGTVNADQFSARWTRSVNFSAGTYRFSVTADDGVRLWVNGHLLVDAWRDQAPTTYTGDLYLPGGSAPIKMEYYENGGGATARLSWAPASQTIIRWRGEYYNNMSLSGTPALVRDDNDINFDWGDGSPAPGTIRTDRFSVRWKRTINQPAGMYHYTITTDDGVRLWVNGQLMVDAWRDQAPTMFAGDVQIAGGNVSLQIDYYENGGGALARFSWGPGQTPEGDAVIVDDGEAGFVTGGDANGWHTASEGYGGRVTWTRNNDWARWNYDWARWYPRLKAGRYEVMAHIPERYSTTAQARYWVAHASGFTSRTVNQENCGGQWVSLGTYRFLGNGKEYVSLSDVTGEERLTRLIAFDAVKWVPR